MAGLTEDVVDAAETIGGDISEIVMDGARGGINPGVQVALGTTLGIGIGALIGYKLAYRKLTQKFDELVDQEFAKMEAHFHAKTVARQEKGSMEEMVRNLGYTGNPAVEPPAIVKQAAPILVESDVPVEGVTVTTTSIFREEKEEVWDQATEQALRDSNPNQPYIITFAEFGENVHQHSQETLTLFEGCGTLVDDQDRIIPPTDVEERVGMGNLNRIGHGSNDPHLLYIRNEMMAADYEVAVSFGTYAQTVAGFDPPDEDLRHERIRRGTRRGFGDE